MRTSVASPELWRTPISERSTGLNAMLPMRASFRRRVSSPLSTSTAIRLRNPRLSVVKKALRLAGSKASEVTE